MTAATDRAAQLRAAIDDIAPRHEALPPIVSGAKGWIQSHDLRRQAAEALIGHVRRQHGAKVRVGMADANRMRLHGVTVSCTSGLCNTVGAWLTKARRQLAALEREARR